MTGSTGVACNHTSATWTCTVGPSATNPTMTVTNYGKTTGQSEPRWACSSGLTILSQTSTGSNPVTVFSLFGLDENTSYTFNIQAVNRP